MNHVSYERLVTSQFRSGARRGFLRLIRVTLTWVLWKNQLFPFLMGLVITVPATEGASRSYTPSIMLTFKLDLELSKLELTLAPL